MKKSIKFHNLRVFNFLNFSLLKSPHSLKFLDQLEQALCEIFAN